MAAKRIFPSLVILTTLSLGCLVLAPQAAAQQTQADRARADAAAERMTRHQTPEWLNIAPHLPDVASAAPAQLEVAADVLRARRMPEDALEYYRYALNRGGDEARLMNRIGITLLELHRNEEARAAFKRALALKNKDAEGWNNLGAAEYVSGNYQGAISDYHRAVKLNKKAAVFHSNLGTAYFEVKDYDSARQQFETAVKLDPAVFERGGSSGIQAHVMSPKDRGRFCFEMARIAARKHDDASVLHWLAQSSETGFDVQYEMKGDRDFAPYWKDARLALLLKNARAMRSGQIAVSGPAPVLPAEGAKLN